MRDAVLKRAREVLDIEIEALGHVRDRLGETFAEAVELLAACKGRVALTGIGKSGLIGRKIAATLSSTGAPAYFLHPVEGLHGDIGLIRPEDAVIAVSYSGKTEELLTLLLSIRGLGPKVIALTSGLDSPLAALADLVLDVTVAREACSMNLVPTSSTTATLALGDALAVCLMDRRNFNPADFARYHPGGSLGRRLSLAAADVMHRENLPLARSDAPLGEVLRVLDTGGFGAVILTGEEDELAGIITDGDLRRLVCAGGLKTADPASAVMRTSPSCADLGMSAAELMDIMELKAITVLPVVDGERRVRGLVHLHDLLGKGSLRFSKGGLHL
ncbi:MAG: KpsF/GutQ family sugar-phosphate isomerase [Desulfovibrio sp.]|jgi:arabinose-5-phosphate isomerase|nr:KpsF/GutQ family sugar-phosphate isomerase [Desulfovibrio sp.]